MAKTPKNKKKQRSRSTSPQLNAPMQRTPNAPTQRTPRVVSDAIAGMQWVLSSSSKAIRRGKNQDLGATVQQGNASTIANAPSASPPDSSNLGANAMKEHGVMDPDASLLSELGSRAPCFGTNVSNCFTTDEVLVEVDIKERSHGYFPFGFGEPGGISSPASA